MPERPAQLGRSAGARRRGRRPARRRPGTRVIASARSGVHSATARGELGEAARGARDEVLVHQAGGDDLVGDGVGQRDVAADVEREPQVGEGGGLGAAGVDDARGARRCATARSTWWKKIGWVSRALEPQRTTTSASSTSR